MIQLKAQTLIVITDLQIWTLHKILCRVLGKLDVPRDVCDVELRALGLHRAETLAKGAAGWCVPSVRSPQFSTTDGLLRWLSLKMTIATLV